MKHLITRKPYKALSTRHQQKYSHDSVFIRVVDLFYCHYYEYFILHNIKNCKE